MLDRYAQSAHLQHRADQNGTHAVRHSNAWPRCPDGSNALILVCPHAETADVRQLAQYAHALRDLHTQKH